MRLDALCFAIADDLRTLARQCPDWDAIVASTTPKETS